MFSNVFVFCHQSLTYKSAVAEMLYLVQLNFFKMSLNKNTK